MYAGSDIAGCVLLSVQNLIHLVAALVAAVSWPSPVSALGLLTASEAA
jgi:hypothetical protein